MGQRGTPPKKRGLKSPDAEEPRQAGIQSLEIGMRVLEALGTHSRAMSLKEICTATEMAPSKLHRYLVSFVRTGMLTQYGPSGMYDFGPAARRLGMMAMGRIDSFGVASDHIVKLRDETGHTISLATWGDEGPTVIRWEVGDYPMYISVRVGSIVPLTTSAIGRVYLAHLPSAVTTPVWKRQRSLAGTDDSISLPTAKELDQVRSARSIYTRSALITGIDAIAAPVFNVNGGVSSVVSLLGPHRFFQARARKKLHREVEQAVDAISTELGYLERSAVV